MITIESRIQKVVHTTIKDIPVIKYCLPSWNKQTKQTDWYNITAWNPANPDQYRNGKKAKVTFTAKPRNNGGFFYNQREIAFIETDKEHQLTLPGM